jgi:hypothetical protein
MITPEQITEQCNKWWKEILIAAIDENDCFPKTIDRIGRIRPAEVLEKFNELSEAADRLRRASKAVKGYGYEVIYTTVDNRKIGRNEFPELIRFAQLDDYLLYTRRQKEYRLFCRLKDQIISAIPALKEWLRKHPLKVLDYEDNWEGLLAVCNYFLQTPQPHLYIRQLRIPLQHTKFIEQHKSVLQSLLRFLIGSYMNTDAESFEEQLHLKTDEKQIRLRYLDAALAPAAALADIQLPVSAAGSAAFGALLNAVHTVMITENKMNFLCLPPLPGSIAIWSGGGFQVSHLSDIPWLHSKRILYWGDIDVQGFQILNQIRTYFPHTEAIMMNDDTLHTYQVFAGRGTPPGKYTLSHLTETEQQLYVHLEKNNLRLEQEMIPQEYAEKKLHELYHGKQQNLM